MNSRVLRDIYECAELFLPENIRSHLAQIRRLPDGEKYSIEFSSENDPFINNEQVIQILALEGSVDKIETTQKDNFNVITGYATRRRRIVASIISWSPSNDEDYLKKLKNAPGPLRNSFHLIKLRGDENLDFVSAFIEKLVATAGSEIEIGLRCDISAIGTGSDFTHCARQLRDRFSGAVKIRTLLIDGVSLPTHWQVVDQVAREGEFEFDLSILAVSGIGASAQTSKAFTTRMGYKSLDIDPRCPDAFMGADRLIRFPRTPYTFGIRAKLRRYVATWLARIVFFRTRLMDHIYHTVYKRWDHFIKRRNPVYAPYLNVLDPRPRAQKGFFDGIPENSFLEHVLPIDWPQAGLVARIGRVLDTGLQEFFRSSANLSPRLAKFWQSYTVHNWATPDYSHGVLLDVSVNSYTELIEFMRAQEKNNRWRVVDSESYLAEVTTSLTTMNSQSLNDFQIDAHGYQSCGGREVLSEDGIALINWIDGELGALLEIGAGYGLTVERLHSRSSFCVAIDLTVAQAKSCTIKGARSVVGDMHDLPIADAIFDTVIADNTLEHGYDPKKLLLEIRRVLRKGGKLFAVLPPDGFSRWYNIPTHFWKLDELSLRHAASMTGFKVTRLKYLRYEDIGMHGGFNSSGGKTILVELVAV